MSRKQASEKDRNSDHVAKKNKIADAILPAQNERN